jgi:hypothetical protein
MPWCAFGSTSVRAEERNVHFEKELKVCACVVRACVCGKGGGGLLGSCCLVEKPTCELYRLHQQQNKSPTAGWPIRDMASCYVTMTLLQ